MNPTFESAHDFGLGFFLPLFKYILNYMGSLTERVSAVTILDGRNKQGKKPQQNKRGKVNR